MSLFVGNKYDQNMAKFHSVKRSEREAWMPNWPFNMDVICFRKAHMDAFAACLGYIKINVSFV
ncbi:hypothetical protein Q4557_08305 [Shewanella sp. 5_MG-2023]|uniref:hypothetical protein n=1 Tax=Shewanella sp. 5_MG-2023 TaxID=3062656 RepID=UPI0026E38DCF|nr:hypothetical protein [Shewanella sp. 5_MG-2023]MDO6639960.1 hypothetical protein [Shewanella sp. 5_MG-2023]